MITSQNGDGHGDGDTRQLMMWQVYAGQGRAGQGRYMQGRAVTRRAGLAFSGMCILSVSKWWHRSCADDAQSRRVRLKAGRQGPGGGGELGSGGGRWGGSLLAAPAVWAL